MPKFTANLSVESLDRLIVNVNDYRQKVENAPQKIASELAQIGTDEINSVLTRITDTDGNAIGSVGQTVLGNTATVWNAGEQVAYIEYGTGAVGKSQPHPTAGDIDWQYDVGKKIRATKSGKRMWRYWDNLKGHWRITDGLAAQMQAFKAAQKMRSNITRVAKEALR